jgi:hypothetical protein
MSILILTVAHQKTCLHEIVTQEGKLHRR